MKITIICFLLILSACSSKYKGKSLDSLSSSTLNQPQVAPVTVAKKIQPKTQNKEEKLMYSLIKITEEPKETTAAINYIWGNEEETIKYEAFGIGLNAGTAVMKINPDKLIDGIRVLHFSLELETSSFFSNVYYLKSRIESFVTKDSFEPKRYSVSSFEGNNKKQVLENYNLKNKTTFLFKQYNDKVEKNQEINLEVETGKYVDLLQVLFYLRQNANKVNNDKLFVINNGKIKTIIISKLSDNDIVEHQSKKYSCMKFKIQEAGKKEQLVWLETAKKNRIIKIELSLPVGSGKLLIKE